MGGSFDGPTPSSDDIAVVDRRVLTRYEIGTKLGKGTPFMRHHLEAALPDTII